MNEQTKAIQVSDSVDDEIEIDLIELLYYYQTKLAAIIVAFVIGALAAGLVTHFLITPKYQATSKLYMVSASSDSVVNLADLNIGTSLSSDYEELLKIRPIFEEIIKENNLPYTYEELLNMVAIATIEDTRILTVTAESPDPKEAQTVANALADKALTYLPKLMETSKPNLAEYAILPEFPSSPSLPKNTIIGALVGLAFALGVLTFRYITDDTLKTADDVEKFFGVMPLSVIPEGDMPSSQEEKEDARKKYKSKYKKKHRRKRSTK